MAFSRLVFTILLVSVSCYASNVPVFIWGDRTAPIKVNPLEASSTENFANIYKRALAKDPFTVVFIEPTLSPEDISSKNEDGSSLLSYLAQQAETGRFSYLPAVDSPVHAIDENTDQTKVDYINLSEEALSAELQSSNSKYLFVNLKDAKDGESRAAMLKRHNDFMRNTIEELKKNRNEDIVAIYTGLEPSWMIPSHSHRVRRQAASNQTEDYILDGVRMYVELLQVNDNGVVYNLTNRPSSSMSNDEATRTMNTTVTFGDRSFIMSFRNKGGYWYFDSVTLQNTPEEVLYPSTKPYALMGHSYRCGQKTVFNSKTNSTRTVTFKNLQIQPFFGTINETSKFGDTFDCVGLFTAPILSCLLVTFILLAITFYGIMMMMDIKTMDRFDDPKGKTITINATE